MLFCRTDIPLYIRFFHRLCRTRLEFCIELKVIRTRILKLLWPYLIWSIAIFVAEGVLGTTYSVSEYLVQLLTGKTLGPFYFVPMLFQFYILSPVICRLGKSHPVALLSIAAGLQLAGLAYVYVELGGLPVPGANDYLWLFVWYALYFPLGVVAGLQLRSFQAIIVRFRWWLAAATAGFAVASILEAEWLYRTAGDFWLAQGMVKISTVLYAVAFILTFLAFDWSPNKLWQGVSWIGQRSYGIYLSSSVVLYLFAHLISRFVPQMLSQQLLFAEILTFMTVVFILMGMTMIARSPLRPIYRYLFG